IDVRCEPAIRLARVLDRSRIWMARCEPVADVHDHVTEAREHQAHQPVRVLRQQVERTAVSVEHDRPRPGALHRAGDVELVPARVVAVYEIALDLDAMPLRPCERMQLAERGQPFEEARRRERTRSPPQRVAIARTCGLWNRCWSANGARGTAGQGSACN